MTNLNDAAKSDWSTSIATIAGGKAHRVSTRTLLEDAEVVQKMPSGRTVTKTLAAGETLYYGTACGTQRNASFGMVWMNDYRPADEVTCTKCLAKEEPVVEVEEVVETGSVTVKFGRLWAYVYDVDGNLMAEVRRDSFATVGAALGIA